MAEAVRVKVLQMLQIMCNYQTPAFLNLETLENIVIVQFNGELRDSSYMYYTFKDLVWKNQVGSLQGTLEEHAAIHQLKYQELLGIDYPLEVKGRGKLPKELKFLNSCNRKKLQRLSNFMRSIVAFIYNSDMAWNLVAIINAGIEGNDNFHLNLELLTTMAYNTNIQANVAGIINLQGPVYNFELPGNGHAYNLMVPHVYSVCVCHICNPGA